MKADVKDKIKCLLLLAGYTPAFDFFFCWRQNRLSHISHFWFL